MSDLIEEIAAAAGKFQRVIFDHPQYIEGTLYVNQAQYNALREVGGDAPTPLTPQPFLATGIPVVLVKPGDKVTLPSGKVLMYSDLLDSFFVFDTESQRLQVDKYKMIRL